MDGWRTVVVTGGWGVGAVGAADIVAVGTAVGIAVGVVAAARA